MAKAGNPNWKKGQSGNPGGRIKNPFTEIIAKATKDGKEITTVVLKLLRTSESENLKLCAAEWLRDTGWGKPKQMVEHSGEVGNVYQSAQEVKSMVESWLAEKAKNHGK